MCSYEHNRWRTTQQSQKCASPDPDRCNVLFMSASGSSALQFCLYNLTLIKPFLSSFVSFYNRKSGPRLSEHHHWCDVSHMGTATCCAASYAGRHFGIALFHLNPNFFTLRTAHKCTKPHLLHFSSDFQSSTKHRMVRMTEDSSSTWN